MSASSPLNGTNGVSDQNALAQIELHKALAPRYAYRYSFEFSRLFQQDWHSEMISHVPSDSKHILDLGCGTGLSGEALQRAGFQEIDGYDFSEGMLALARKKECYRTLVHVDLAQPDSIPDRGYRHAVLAGVLHHTHAPPETLAQTLARLPQEGCIVFSLNDETLRFPEYTDYISNLVDSGQVAVVSQEYGQHLPGRDVGARVYVLRKC